MFDYPIIRKYSFREDDLVLHVNGNDLATLLILTGKENLLAISFEMQVEIVKLDGTTENMQLELPTEVRLAGPQNNLEKWKQHIITKCTIYIEVKNKIYIDRKRTNFELFFKLGHNLKMCPNLRRNKAVEKKTEWVLKHC